MKLNKIGNIIKKDGHLTKLFGILSKYTHALLIFHEKIELTENYGFEMQKWRKTLLEIEVGKDRAIDFAVNYKTVKYK